MLHVQLVLEVRLAQNRSVVCEIKIQRTKVVLLSERGEVMFERIVSNIICTEFDRTYGRSSPVVGYCSDPDHAMKFTFSLSTNYDVEEGYRNMDILIYGGGLNYISVYARTDWNVIRNEWSDGERLKKGREYIKGQTPWILYGHHDSGWRDAVYDLLWKNRERISHIDTLFNNHGWWTEVPVNEEFRKELDTIRHHTPGYGTDYDAKAKRQRIEDLEFQFGAENKPVAVK